MKRLALLIVLVTLPASACGSNGAVGEGPISDVVSNPPSSGDTSTPTTGVQVSYQVWFTKGEKLWPVIRSEPKTTAVGGASIDALLAGPSATERAHGIGTLLPADTSRPGLRNSGGTATVH